MGVRARVAEWPPRSKDPKEPPGKNSQNSTPNFKPFRRAKDVEFRQGFLGISGMPLRQRSSSEVTLSECDPEESAEIRGNSLGSAGMFREYGSTSSIDVQGIPEQSFFEMLNEFRAKKPEFSAIKPEIKAENRDETPQSKEKRRRCLRTDESIFKKLRNPKDPEEPRLPKSWICRKGFAHFDVQSLFFEAVSPGAAGAAARRRNTTTGASAASAASDPAFSSTEDLNSKENLEKDLGDDTSNELLLSCPHFRNEIGGGRGERDVSFSKSSSPPSAVGISGSSGFFLECGNFGKTANAGISVLEVPKEQQRDPERLRRFSVEHADLGARYYRDYFHGKEHSNYFGLDERLGPVAVSARRE
ncbi:SI1L3 protein, partial [Hippolais icterina]|nr:SI1L3 protein [Hippolais icterina]